MTDKLNFSFPNKIVLLVNALHIRRISFLFHFEEINFIWLSPFFLFSPQKLTFLSLLNGLVSMPKMHLILYFSSPLNLTTIMFFSFEKYCFCDHQIMITYF